VFFRCEAAEKTHQSPGLVEDFKTCGRLASSGWALSGSGVQMGSLIRDGPVRAHHNFDAGHPGRKIDSGDHAGDQGINQGWIWRRL